MNRPDRGQAAVELGLALPLVVVLLLGLVQVGLVVRDQVLLTHVAREAVRAASLVDNPEAVEQTAHSAGPLDADRLEVTVAERGSPGEQVTVEVGYDATRVPLVGVMLPDIRLRASASMRVER